MFDIGFFEVLIIFVVGIILIGPEKLPEVLKYIFLTVRKIKDQFNDAKEEVFTTVYKRIRSLLKKPVQNGRAKQWIRTQLDLKKR